MIEWVLIAVARLALPLIALLPLRWVARLGRAGGTLAWHLDRRHRKVALDNLERCFGDGMSAAERRALAIENFRRIGENYVCGVRTAMMTEEQVRAHLEFAGLERLTGLLDRHPQRSVIAAIGHFGNFELFAWARLALPGVQLATTYRGLRQEVATRILLRLRRRTGCLFFERRREAAALRAVLRDRRVILGLLADQHDGRGVRVPLLGREAGTSTAPAILALRYGCPLMTAFCFRLGLARWRLEFGEPIATRDAAGRPRALADIATDMNRSFEAAIRRDPANWFWVHRRWKPGPSDCDGRGKRVRAAGSPAPATAWVSPSPDPSTPHDAAPAPLPPR